MGQGELSSSYSVCDNGVRQSPIDIPTVSAGYLSTSSSSPLLDNYSPEAGLFYVVQSHGAPTYFCKDMYDSRTAGCGSLTWNGVTYNLLQVGSAGAGAGAGGGACCSS